MKLIKNGLIIENNKLVKKDILINNNLIVDINDNIDLVLSDSSSTSDTDDELINLSECSSLVLHVNEKESVISFRRDSTDPADLTITEEKWGDISIVKQYKTAGGYFYHVIVTSNGWVIGDGGVTDGDDNRRMESISREMVTNNVISNDYLARIYNILSSDSLGHYVIKAPDGTYGVVFTNLYHVGKLSPGEYVLCPNVYRMSQRDYYDSSLNPVDAAIKIIRTDSYGVNRRNVMTYHYKEVQSSTGLSMGVDVYASNDNGAGVGRSTAGLADNVYYFGQYYSRNSLPQTPNKLFLGTHIFENTAVDIFTLLEPVGTALVGDDINIKYKVDYIPNSNPVVRFNIPDGINFVSADVSKGQYSYDSNSVIWNLNNCDKSNYITLKLRASQSGTYTVSSSLDNVNFDVKFSAVNYGAVISGSDVTKYCKGPQKLTVYLKDTQGNPLIGEKINININGVDYAKTITDKGSTSLSLNLNSGDYVATVSYNGHFGANSTQFNVKILPTISGNDIVKMFGNATQYVAAFTDTSGNPLANQQVTFNINGVFYDRNTNANGVARLNIWLNPNDYIVTAINPVNGEQYSNIVKVLPILVEGHDLTKYYRNDSVYSIRVLDDQGNPLANAAVTFNINGIFYTRTSGSDGYAKLNIRLQPDEYIVTAEYNGYKCSNIVTVLPVLFANDTVCYSNESNFTVKLINGQGNPFGNQTIKFNIGGMLYENATDENGIAGLFITLPLGEHIVTSTYDEYNISNKITMKESQ